MVFSSLLFLFVFLVITLIGYYIIPSKCRNSFLLAVSLFFYAWGEPSYVIIMIFSIFINWIAGLCISAYKAKKMLLRAKFVLILCSVIDIGMLVYFKYTKFIFDNISAIFKISFPFDSFIESIVMPIGISFYTFQMMSYVIDVWRDETDAQKNIIDFGCYVTLFPQLIAGPIVQYKTVAEQLRNRHETVKKFSEGACRFVIGLGKKILLADNAATIWEKISENGFESAPSLTALIATLAYSFQIYFDFSGYSDMAIGLGKMLGFEFLENFNYPYISKSVTEFWRRWHISLSSWFRDYVYIPLGGNKKGTAKQIRNIAVVWICTGIWHGAHWNYVIWGAWFGILLIFEKFFLLKHLQKLPSFVSHLWALFCAWFGWVIFANEDMASLVTLIKSLLGLNGGFADENSIWLLSNYALLLVILAIASTPLFKKLYEKIKNTSVAPVLRVLFVVSVFTLSLAYIVSSTKDFFIYFRF